MITDAFESRGVFKWNWRRGCNPNWRSCISTGGDAHRASFSERKLVTPPSKTPFLAGVSVETHTWKIQDL